jgi:3-hydroxyisobutyrate dehydrogenase
VSRTIGLAGLGIMGSGIAARLLERGHALTVWDRDAEPRERAVALGARSVESPEALAAASSTLISILWDDAVSRAIVLERIVPAMAPATTLIEMSTIGSALQRELAAAATARGLFFLESPVTGSRDAARTGELTAYVGGPESVLENERPLLETIAQRVVHVGGYGSSAALKLANNQLIALLASALGESLAMTERAGLDRTLALELFIATCGRVPAMKRGAILARDWEPHFSVDALLKDVRAALRSAQEMDVALPVLSAAEPAFARLSESGSGRLDFSLVVDAIASGSLARTR